MKPYLILIVFALSFLACSQQLKTVKKGFGNSSFPASNIIPKPVSVHFTADKSVLLNNKSIIVADPRFSAQSNYLKEEIQHQCGLRLSVKSVESKASSLVLDYDSILVDKPEMYILTVRNNRIEIKARDVLGIVHGIQTLLQLLPLNPVENSSVPSVVIKDYPKYSYRGMHLDVSRHFFPVDFVKKYIDYLAFYKFNNFHWHLTDDQGWRIEIKSYPKLTEIGAWRDSTLVGHFYKDKQGKYDGVRHGGFYTQEQVKDIIRYASVRGVNVIPEIDIPGHSRAAIAAYPELSTNPDTTWNVATAWGMYNRENNVLAPTAATFQFLRTVFNEVADLFPSPYIHIGGDECSEIWWKNDPKTQDFMKQHGLKDESALQTYFIQQVIDALKLKGKKVVGWDEILAGKLDTSAIIMNWRGVKSAISAAQRGHNVIMTPSNPLYFDYYQTKDKDSLGSYGYNPLDAVYNYKPVPKKIDSLDLNYRVLGAQGNVWTEYMQYPSKVEYMIFPRMTALSEALWTESDQKDYANFLTRLKKSAIPRYKFWGSSFFKEYEYWDSSK